MVSWLLTMGADISIRNDYNSTALIEAAEKGHIDVVNILLRIKENACVLRKSAGRALMVAAKNGHLNVVTALLESPTLKISKRDKSYALRHASKSAHIGISQKLRIEEADLACIVGLREETPLIWAARDRNVKVVQKLLEWGEDPDEAGIYRVTPLLSHVCTYDKNCGFCGNDVSYDRISASCEIVSLLVRYGAKLYYDDCYNSRRFIFFAASQSSMKVRLIDAVWKKVGGQGLCPLRSDWSENGRNKLVKKYGTLGVEFLYKLGLYSPIECMMLAILKDDPEQLLFAHAYGAPSDKVFKDLGNLRKKFKRFCGKLPLECAIEENKPKTFARLLLLDSYNIHALVGRLIAISIKEDREKKCKRQQRWFWEKGPSALKMNKGLKFIYLLARHGFLNAEHKAVLLGYSKNRDIFQRTPQVILQIEKDRWKALSVNLGPDIEQLIMAFESG